MKRYVALGIIALVAILIIHMDWACTGNAAISKKGLSEQEKTYLLGLARETLESYLNRGEIPQIDENSLAPNMLKQQGCFVTLNKYGRLRGCIGHILPQVPLYQCVIQNAISAALHDTRFNPVSYDELNDIEIEISVLSVPYKLEFNTSEELLDMLRPGIDGVVIRYRGRTSTYLPQVWESIPRKEDFLSRLCMKQGSRPDCWRVSDARIETYQALVFSE